MTAPSRIATPSGDVSVALDGPERPRTLVVLGHGAGAGLDSPFMAHFAQGLSSDERAVARFNFPYMEQGRRSPGPQSSSEAAFGAVVAALRDALKPRVLVLGGKSYGGRIASHVVAQDEPADALVFLGYPLHPPGRPERLRDEHLYAVGCPMLFVEGTRDPFCPLDTLERVRSRLSVPNEVVVIEDGDHSLKVRKSSGRSTTEAWDDAIGAINRWLAAQA